MTQFAEINNLGLSVDVRHFELGLRILPAALLLSTVLANPLPAQDNNTPVFDLVAMSCSFHVTFERVHDHTADIALSIDLANPGISQQCRELDRMWDFLFTVHEVSLATGDRFDWLLAAIIQEARSNLNRTHLVSLLPSAETSEQSYLERLSSRGRRYAMIFGATGEPRRVQPPPPPGAPSETDRFDIPVICDNGARGTGSLTISESWAEMVDLERALVSLAEATGCTVPQYARDGLVALFQIALENEVSFANLARNSITEALLPPRPDRPVFAREVIDFWQRRFTTMVYCTDGTARLEEVEFWFPHRSEIPGSSIEKELQYYDSEAQCTLDPRLVAVLTEILEDAEARNVLFVDALHAAIDGVGPFADAIREIDFLPSYWRPHPVPLCRYPSDREFAVIGNFRFSTEVEETGVLGESGNYGIRTTVRPLDTNVQTYFSVNSHRLREQGNTFSASYESGLAAVSSIVLNGLSMDDIAQIATDLPLHEVRFGITWQGRDGVVRESLLAADNVNSFGQIYLDRFTGPEGHFGLSIARAALSGAGLTLRIYSGETVLAETMYGGAELRGLFSDVIEAVENLVAARDGGTCRATLLP